MNLIDRYVTEVGKHLPRKTRMDIETELRSTLEDMLEDRSQQTGRPADEALATELLQEYGSPEKVAATYQTHPYLIGPRWFPTYTLVLKIVIFAVTLGLTVATVVGIATSNTATLEQLGKFVANLVSGLIAAFGNVTLVFAILERAASPAKFEDKETWTPAELTKEPEPSQVKTADMIASILFTAAALVLFNFYPQVIGIWNMVDGQWTVIAGLSDAFFRYLPWINLSGVLTIALDIWLLRQGKWETVTSLMHIVLQVIGVGIAAAMLRGPSLLKLYPIATGTDAVLAMTRVMQTMVPVILMIVIVVSAVEIAKDIMQMLRTGKTSLPFTKSA